MVLIGQEYQMILEFLTTLSYKFGLQKYAANTGLSGSYGHDYCNASAAELVHWNNVATKAECRGRTICDIYRK